MKKLTRMKLINWHRFTNCIIDFERSTLLSGENGAGKSTILDAIQFVVTCSANAFNKAAHENGKRKLTGYIRCKTGKENKTYERTGQLSAHVALEFYEESKKRYFILGAVVDSASEGQETTVRYLVDNQQLSDEMFLHGQHIRSISEFRTANKGIRQWCTTQSEAKKMVLGKLGRIEDKFFRLIPKALAFKPIDDMKDFVYSYVLDEKEVNIDVLQENVRTYQDLERTLDSVKKRMSKLEQIEKFHGEVCSCEKRDQTYAFYLEQSQLDITKKKIQDVSSQMQAEVYRQKEIQQKVDRLCTERNSQQEIATNLRVEMKQNKDFLALEEQEKEKKRLLDEEKTCLAEKNELLQSAKKAAQNAKELLKVSDADVCVGRYHEMLKTLGDLSETAEMKELTGQVIGYKKVMYGKLQQKIAEVQVEMNTRRQEREEIRQKIKRLEKKKLTYPDGVEQVLSAIQEEFARIGRKAEPHVICELLEVKDEEWRNAAEGYLNSQRFHILVEPDQFDIALGTYDRLRREKKAYGVGLINARKLEEYEETPEGTLASVLTSKNRYARCFINMILGKVKLCDRYEDLKKYPVSITKECMRYQNRVASAIHPKIFSVPFIGSHALKVQLEQEKKKKEQLDESIGRLEERFDAMKHILTPLNTDIDVEIKYHLDVLTQLHLLQNEIKKCEANIRTLKKNATVIQKQIQLEALDKLLADLQREIDAENQDIGIAKQTIKEKESQLRSLREQQEQLECQVKELLQQAGDLANTWIKEYETQTSQKSYEQFRENFDRQRKANETLRKKYEEEMQDRMILYKTEHDFGAAPNMKGYPEFAAVYERLKTSELLEYEEKVQSARRSAEDEFREQFLAKLQENMKQAQGEFKELNRALKDITFSREQYEFIFMPSGKYRRYYDMIMDDFNVVQGESIFSGIFHETHKEVIDELFEKLALKNENSTKTLAEFTDYRTYMDYDIKILHADGSFSYYSKVCEEKSGGETQTPFYVTVAASFVQLYKNNIGGEAAGLVLFDEAFNNMDDERIGGVLEFLNRLPLQLIIAAPPDKIQYIGPSVEETLLIMTDEKTSFVEKYCHAI